VFTVCIGFNSIRYDLGLLITRISKSYIKIHFLSHGKHSPRYTEQSVIIRVCCDRQFEQHFVATLHSCFISQRAKHLFTTWRLMVNQHKLLVFLTNLFFSIFAVASSIKRIVFYPVRILDVNVLIKTKGALFWKCSHKVVVGLVFNLRRV
jgi:hypothetical protein